MLRKLNLIFTITATILLGFAAADSTQAQTPCTNCEGASLFGDTVSTQFNSGPVVSKVVNSTIELPNAGPTLGFPPGSGPRWNIDFTANMIRINFLQPVTTYPANSAFKFTDLNPQLSGCEAYIGSFNLTTSKPPAVFNVAAATTITPDSVTVPLAGSTAVTWNPGEYILIQLIYKCRSTCCDRMTATPLPNPPLQQTYKTFDFYNLKSPASNICSVDIAFSPLPHTGSWQGGGLFIDSGSGPTPIPPGTKFIWNYNRVPNNPPGSVIAAVPSSPTSPSLRFNLGFDNTQAYTGIVTFKVNHCDGTFCTLTNQWIVNPNTGGTQLPFRQSIRDLNAEFSELTLTYNAEREIELAKGVKGAKWLGLNLLSEDAEIYSVDGAEVPNEKASGENKRLSLNSSSTSPKAALFEFGELLNPNSREQNDKTITIIIKKNVDKKVEPKIVLSLYDENANLIASDGQN